MDIREFAKQFKGVTIRGNGLQVAFTYQGERCRETIPVVPSKTSLKNAADRLQKIKLDIKFGTFDYTTHFPNSKKVLKFSNIPGRAITIENAIKEWYRRNFRRWQLSTRRDYEQSIWSKLIPEFGDLRLTELTPSMVKDWISSLQISNKRINNTLCPLRQMYEEAYYDGLIESNPMARVKNLTVIPREPNPFKPDEVKRILDYLDGQERNYFQFAFWSGLRTSELIALRWQDVDFDNNRVHVRIAKVLGKEKCTKTHSGQRTVELQPQAREALMDQMQHSKNQDTVFLNPRTDYPWKNDQPLRRLVWMPTLKALNIEYRNPYQTRHTFASNLLSRGEPPMWVAQQMGHKDWGMIRMVYGRWIPN